ncbi:hypothetical protein CJ208_04870 [Finegoldia magna]|uniref:DUF5105 domain-containing protein n=1 Tax=Finegoldia magna TaxID=1260 RepID=A0A2N6SSV5_FINMA|nr:hypothetical protein [Finegoldia magna]MDU2898556.1 hypothetical protein [Finegoldia magna]MDU5224601.1 hypothetical protein [Finegoldia magna]MDU5369060.1 hypothetical protein [Finegoldia magna]MDU5998420.1 hypothetical protein [Finegoldia magna]PMC60160.1 hypothetical protein CJ208_04870 [Finegoldia magna]
MTIGKLRKTITLVIMMLLLLSSCQKNKIKNDEQKANQNETVKVDVDEKDKANINETVKMFFTQKYYKLEKDTNKIRLSESLEKFLAKKPDYKYYELSELKILDTYESKDKILVLVKTWISTKDKKSGEGVIMRILISKDKNTYVVEKEVAEDMIESANYQTKLSQKDIKNYIKKSLIMNGDNLSDSEIDKNIKDFDLFNFYSYMGMFEVQKSKETNEDLIHVLENHEYK